MKQRKGGIDISSSLEDFLNGKRSVDDLFDGCINGEERCRLLWELSETRPGLIYKRWKELERLLDSDEPYKLSTALNVIANLSLGDSKDNMTKLLERYFDNLDNDILVAARYTAM